MARTSEGWKLWRNREGGPWSVRFTHGGRRYNLGTGRSDRGEAAHEAAVLWAEVVHGQRRPAQVAAGAPPLEDLLPTWCVDLKATHDEKTVGTCELYSAWWLGFFGDTLASVTRESAASYTRARLQKVQRRTVLKELSALRTFLRWCVEKGHLVELPVIDVPPRKATGRVARPERKRQAVELSPDEVEAILAEVPEWSPGGKRGGRSRCARATWSPTRLRCGRPCWTC